MTAILGFLTSRVGAFISAGLAVALLLAMIVLKLQIHSLHSEIGQVQGQLAAAQRDLAQCHANTATLQGGIDRQNAAIQAQATAAAQRDADLTRVASQARQDAQTAQQRAAAILARPRTGNSCADADAAILEAIH